MRRAPPTCFKQAFPVFIQLAYSYQVTSRDFKEEFQMLKNVENFCSRKTPFSIKSAHKEITELNNPGKPLLLTSSTPNQFLPMIIQGN